MADIFTPEKRSTVMSAIRGSGNSSTELRLIRLMREHGIWGWRRKQKIPGHPDFVFRKERLAVFVDGDFWHGNQKTSHIPKSNADFWRKKIHRNIARDKEVARQLRKSDWQVLRIWESSLKKNPERQIKRLLRLIERDLEQKSR